MNVNAKWMSLCLALPTLPFASTATVKTLISTYDPRLALKNMGAGNIAPVTASAEIPRNGVL